jgi:hypothetical protein
LLSLVPGSGPGLAGTSRFGVGVRFPNRVRALREALERGNRAYGLYPLAGTGQGLCAQARSPSAMESRPPYNGVGASTPGWWKPSERERVLKDDR